MRRDKRKRSGISEIIGTLLIVLATIAIGSILFVTSSNTLNLGVSNQSNQNSVVIQQLQERIVTYDVWFQTNNSQQVLAIHLYNYGSVVVDIVALYTNASGALAPLTAFVTAYPNGVVVSPQQLQALYIPFTATHGTVYDIVLVSSVSSRFESLWGA